MIYQVNKISDRPCMPCASARNVAGFAKEFLPLDKEAAYAVHLTPNKTLKGYVQTDEKDPDGLIVPALLTGTSSLVVVLSRPKAANPFPSKEDIDNLNRLRSALYAFSIKILDCVIIAKDSFYSFAEENLSDHEE